MVSTTYTIHSSALTATVSAQGAELISLKDRRGQERIWQADPAVWGRHAPLLFPIIGRLRDGVYQLDGKTISISNHGFARDSAFSLVSQQENAVTLALEDSEATRSVYPFSFRLEITFSLEGNVLTKTHRVTNRSTSPMPFELGGHDGYAIALLPGESIRDYSLHFEGTDTIYPHQMEEGTCYICPETLPIPLENGAWKDYPPFLAQKDTAVLEPLAVKKVTLSNRDASRQVILSYPDFDYLGIWTARPENGATYLCLEPWTTLPECTNTTPDLWSKVGIQRAEPGETKTYRFTTELI
jgi:galactose mutarotase-like enzyme